MPLKACVRCGTPSRNARCSRCAPTERPRGNAFEPTRLRIAERDRWTCGLCGDPIDPGLRKPHPQALEIHHVERRADFGSDEDHNLQAAHALCNQQEG